MRILLISDRGCGAGHPLNEIRTTFDIKYYEKMPVPANETVYYSEQIDLEKENLRLGIWKKEYRENKNTQCPCPHATRITCCP